MDGLLESFDGSLESFVERSITRYVFNQRIMVGLGVNGLTECYCQY